MVSERGVHHSPSSQHLNKPLSFCTSTCLTSLAFVVAGSWTCIFGYIFGDPDGTTILQGVDLVSPGGPGLGSQLPVAGWPQRGTVGPSQQLLRASLKEFTCTASPGVSTWDTWLEKETGFWGVDGPQEWVSQTSIHTGGPLSLLLELHATWALCHSSQGHLWSWLAGNNMWGFVCEP